MNGQCHVSRVIWHYTARRPKFPSPFALRKGGDTAGGWPAAITRTSPSPAGCCPGGCGSISTTSTPTAAGPTTWPTRRAIPQRSLALLDWWEKELRDCYAGKVRHPVFVALAETIKQFDIPIDPFVDLLGGVSPGPAGAALRQFRPTARILPLLGQSGRTAGPVSGQVPHARTGAIGRFDLHRAATGQFLAGCRPRLRHRPRLSADWPNRAVSATRPKCSPGGRSTTPSAD